jgi:hypothetical protein
MQSTLTLQETNPQETDPHDAFEIAPGVVLAARAEKASPSLAPDPVGPASTPHISLASGSNASGFTPSGLAAGAPVPPVDTTFRAATVGNLDILSKRSATSRWMARLLVGLLFAVGSAAAAEAWGHYGDTARELIARWTPFTLTSTTSSTQPTQAPDAAAPPASSAAQGSSQVAMADQASTQPAAQASPAPVAAPAVPPSSADPAQMTRDLAAMGQQIEQLKASIEQLKASQEQMGQQMAQQTARDAVRPPPARTAAAKPSDARSFEQSMRAKLAALPPRPAAAPVRKPKPAYSPMPAAAPPLPQPQTAVAPLPPQPESQATTQQDGEPVVRPPVPLR